MIGILKAIAGFAKGAAMVGKKISPITKAAKFGKTVATVGKVAMAVKSLQSERTTPESMFKKLELDTGFYGHMKVPGHKQDKSGYAKL